MSAGRNANFPSKMMLMVFPFFLAIILLPVWLAAPQAGGIVTTVFVPMCIIMVIFILVFSKSNPNGPFSGRFNNFTSRIQMKAQKRMQRGFQQRFQQRFQQVYQQGYGYQQEYQPHSQETNPGASLTENQEQNQLPQNTICPYCGLELFPGTKECSECHNKIE